MAVKPPTLKLVNDAVLKGSASTSEHSVSTSVVNVPPRFKPFSAASVMRVKAKSRCVSRPQCRDTALTPSSVMREHWPTSKYCSSGTVMAMETRVSSDSVSTHLRDTCRKLVSPVSAARITRSAALNLFSITVCRYGQRVGSSVRTANGLQAHPAPREQRQVT
jgi:hypothetical protein